ncbi:MAG TPA: GNAT family N-acetyltransferase [Ferruginibacter sp.]|nr:GNAT family N-acetyltransferase [Ferruginibacter sp.]
MLRAQYSDKKLIVGILLDSFSDNKSVNYIITQDASRLNRIKKLMEYSFEKCYLFGEIYLSDDKNACALLMLPENKKKSIKSLWLDTKFALLCLGLSNSKKTMAREAKIKAAHPDLSMYYLWFIGVNHSQQQKGIGSNLLNEIINAAESQNKIICLETSTVKNIPWYKKYGFTIYKELDFGYRLFCLKRE